MQSNKDRTEHIRSFRQRPVMSKYVSLQGRAGGLGYKTKVLGCGSSVVPVRQPLLTLRSPEILAPARMPVAEGKKMENMPKKLPSMPLQSGTRF